MTSCYIIVKQYTKQAYQSPTEFITVLPMEQELYTDKHGSCVKYDIFLEEEDANKECLRLNEPDPYIKFTVVKGVLK